MTAIIVYQSRTEWYHNECKKVWWKLDKKRERDRKWWNQNKDRQNARRRVQYAMNRSLADDQK